MVWYQKCHVAEGDDPQGHLSTGIHLQEEARAAGRGSTRGRRRTGTVQRNRGEDERPEGHAKQTNSGHINEETGGAVRDRAGQAAGVREGHRSESRTAGKSHRRQRITWTLEEVTLVDKPVAVKGIKSVIKDAPPPTPCRRRPQAQQVSGQFYHPSKSCIKYRPKLGFTSVQMFERHPCRVTWHAVGVLDGTVSNAQTRESSPERPQPASWLFRRLRESDNKRISHVPEGGAQGVGSSTFRVW